MTHPFKIIALFACALWLAAAPVWAQGVINVYGPGGPAPAMQEVAKALPGAFMRGDFRDARCNTP